MPEIKFLAGTHVTEAATALAQLANDHGVIYTGDFNDTTMTARPGDSAGFVQSEWQRESNLSAERYRNSPEGKRAALDAENRKSALQAEMDALMQRFETLDYENLDELVQFFDDLAEPSDHIGVSFDRQRIVDKFAWHGFVVSMNCGDAFNRDDRENYAKYLIGQALDGLNSIGAIMGIYRKFAAEWRNKFATS